MIHKQTIKYKYDGPFTVKDIAQFLHDFQSHKLKEHLISEKEEKEKKGNLNKVTAYSLH